MMEDIVTDDVPVTAAVIHEHPDGRRDTWHRRWRRQTAHYTPGFLYLLGLFILLKVIGVDLRLALIESENYSVPPMYFLFLFAVAITGLEMLKVSQAGVNNIGEVIAMTVMAVTYLAFFLLDAAGARVLWIFAPSTFGNSEFLALVFCAIIEVIVAQVVNARTYGRSIIH